MASFIVRDMGTLGGPQCFPAAVNARGQATGYSITGAGDAHAFRYDVHTGVIAELGPLPGFKDSFGAAINEQGQIVGWSDNPLSPSKSGSARRATLWQTDGSIKDLGLDGAETKALGINGLGQACGVITEPNGVDRGAIWMPGQPVSGLATLGG